MNAAIGTKNEIKINVLKIMLKMKNFGCEIKILTPSKLDLKVSLRLTLLGVVDILDNKFFIYLNRLESLLPLNKKWLSLFLNL